MKFRRFLLPSALLWGLLMLPAAYGQAPPDSLRPDPYASGAGLAVVLSNSGFGLGGYYRYGLGPTHSLVLETSLSAGKDEREVKFFTYFRSYIPNKANYLLLLPVHGGVQRRLFRDDIEDNFRPYLQLTAGPTFGWMSPYFRDCNANGKFDENLPCESGGTEKTYDAFTAFPKGKPRFGMGGLVALGAHFGSGARAAQGVRIGYAFSYFFQEIPLLEADIQGGVQQYFGTPTITLTIGRLF